MSTKNSGGAKSRKDSYFSFFSRSSSSFSCSVGAGLLRLLTREGLLIESESSGAYGPPEILDGFELIVNGPEEIHYSTDTMIP